MNEKYINELVTKHHRNFRSFIIPTGSLMKKCLFCDGDLIRVRDDVSNSTCTRTCNPCNVSFMNFSYNRRDWCLFFTNPKARQFDVYCIYLREFREKCAAYTIMKYIYTLRMKQRIVLIKALGARRVLPEHRYKIVSYLLTSSYSSSSPAIF
jgi:hypothetical protein